MEEGWHIVEKAARTEQIVVRDNNNKNNTFLWKKLLWFHYMLLSL
jgi:hypothetical protein